jgi:hypothetical protein
MNQFLAWSEKPPLDMTKANTEIHSETVMYPPCVLSAANNHLYHASCASLAQGAVNRFNNLAVIERAD